MIPPRVPSNKCSFCKKEVETLLRIFYNCECTMEFWDGFLRLWGSKVGLNVLPDARQILIGDENLSTLVNFLFLIAKRHIYLAKLDNQKPNHVTFKRLLQKIQKVEYWIAIKRNKLTLHNKKWGGILRTLVPTATTQ